MRIADYKRDQGSRRLRFTSSFGQNFTAGYQYPSKIVNTAEVMIRLMLSIGPELVPWFWLSAAQVMAFEIDHRLVPVQQIPCVILTMWQWSTRTFSKWIWRSISRFPDLPIKVVANLPYTLRLLFSCMIEWHSLLVVCRHDAEVADRISAH